MNNCRPGWLDNPQVHQALHFAQYYWYYGVIGLLLVWIFVIRPKL
jgi:hypothetical protein